MPDRYPVSPALSDADLRETLDLLGQVVASMSARIDRHGEMLEAQGKLVVGAMEALAETREAAQLAAVQTDAKTYAGKMVDAMDENLDPMFRKLRNAIDGLHRQHNDTAHRLQQLERAERADLERLRRELRDAAAWRQKVPYIWAGAVALALVLTVALPRFLAGNASACAVLGASWTTTAIGTNVCVFYGR